MKKIAISIKHDCTLFLIYSESQTTRDEVNPDTGVVDSRAMARLARQPWLLGIFSAALLLLPFSIIGPVPFWRTFFAWVAFVPLFYGLLSERKPNPSKGFAARSPCRVSHGRSLVYRQLLLDLPDHAYYGGLPPFISAGILIAYSLVLGLYFAASVCCSPRLQKHSAAPITPDGRAFFLGGARTALGPPHQGSVGPTGLFADRQFSADQPGSLTGVYGCTFVLVAGNALLAWGLLASTPKSRIAIAD